MARMYKDPTQHLDRMSEGAVGVRVPAASQSRLRAHSTANSAPNTTTFAAA